MVGFFYIRFLSNHKWNNKMKTLHFATAFIWNFYQIGFYPEILFSTGRCFLSKVFIGCVSSFYLKFLPDIFHESYLHGTNVSPKNIFQVLSKNNGFVRSSFTNWKFLKKHTRKSRSKSLFWNDEKGHCNDSVWIKPRSRPSRSFQGKEVIFLLI